MKPLVLTLSFLFCLIGVNAQDLRNVVEAKAEMNFDNIKVEPLNHDSLSSTFLIWVKKSVKEHYHQDHTEVVYIIQGEGWMTLNEERLAVKPGDYIFIPKGTRHAVQVSSDVPIKALSVQTPYFDGSDRHFVSQE